VGRVFFRSLVGAARTLGELASLWIDTLRYGFRKPSEFRATVAQLDEIGVRSLPIVIVFSFFVGMVLAVQVAYSEANFAGRAMIGVGVGVAITREFGPLLTALLVGGRVSAGITSVIGSMTVTEQVDAILLLGASPAKKLVFPRLAAAVIAFPGLTALADFLGILGGLVVSLTDIHMTAVTYMSQVERSVSLGDLFHGMSKSVVFGFFIVLISCHQGLRVSGGAEGVGRATTRAVVMSSMCVIVSDFVMTKILVIL
jgi:phospholipid/cholesterol/gamma-HCH transport system permease protein